jgi:Nuclease-related domain
MHVAGDATSRTAGQHARATVVRLRMRTLVTLGVLAVATAALGRAFGLHDKRFLIAEVALLVSMFVITRYVIPLVERRDRGASAEEHVGALLAQLPAEEWHVIHDASFGRGNIDHILIGPPGLFTVETKSHPGPVRVRRVHGYTIRQALAQRDAIEHVMQVRVEPLLVFSHAWVDRPLARRRGVRVLPARVLISHLKKRGRVLTRVQVEEIYERLGQVLADRETSERVVRGRRGVSARTHALR